MPCYYSTRIWRLISQISFLLLAKTEIQELDFLNNVIVTDHGEFMHDGICNIHNAYMWSDENPHAIRQWYFQRQFSIDVCGNLLALHMDFM
jgi:hypothetical protein